MDSALSLYQWYIEYAKLNPVVGGLVGVWILGVLSYFGRNLPGRLGHFLFNRYVWRIHIPASNKGWINAKNAQLFEEWYLKQFKQIPGRNLRIQSCERHDDGRWTSAVGIGFGTHYFFYKKGLFVFRKMNADGNEPGNHVITPTEGCEFMIYGFFSTKANVLAFLSEWYFINDAREPKFYNYSKSDRTWLSSDNVDQRTFDSVVMDEEQKSELIRVLDNFLADEKWYRDNGIIYKLTILLSGPPGTGKTSLIRAIAGYLKRDMYNVSQSCATVEHFYNAVNSITSKSIMSIEDIDVLFDSAKVRGENNTAATPTEKLGLSALLNTLDGLSSKHDLVTIITSNCPEQLDSALTRSGRVDYHFEIGHLTANEVIPFMKKRYEPIGVDAFNSEINALGEIRGSDLIKAYKDNRHSLSGFVQKLKEMKTCQDSSISTHKSLSEISQSLPESGQLSEVSASNLSRTGEAPGRTG